MPPPLDGTFLNFLKTTFPDQLFINDPLGMALTGSKQFLLNFPSLCPPMKMCYNIEDILSFSADFPVVLKLLNGYGGHGIIKIDGARVWKEGHSTGLNQLIQSLSGKPIAFLAVKYLRNVFQGDKRIIVIDGKIMGASLRLPSKGSWLCNVSMGGTSNISEPTPAEIEMVHSLNPRLESLGILMYGLDTLTDDDGARVLSEINTTSIGGLPQIAHMTGLPLLEQATELLWEWIHNKISEKKLIFLP